jgi:hypothetical protein
MAKKSFADKMQEVAQNSRDMNKKYPPPQIVTGPKTTSMRPAKPREYFRSDNPYTGMSTDPDQFHRYAKQTVKERNADIADYESRPGKPKNPGPPPWNETGRETTDRVLGKRGDVNLPIDTAPKKSVAQQVVDAGEEAKKKNKNFNNFSIVKRP